MADFVVEGWDIVRSMGGLGESDWREEFFSFNFDSAGLLLRSQQPVSPPRTQLPLTSTLMDKKKTTIGIKVEVRGGKVNPK